MGKVLDELYEVAGGLGLFLVALYCLLLVIGYSWLILQVIGLLVGPLPFLP